MPRVVIIIIIVIRRNIILTRLRVVVVNTHRRQIHKRDPWNFVGSNRDEDEEDEVKKTSSAARTEYKQTEPNQKESKVISVQLKGFRSHPFIHLKHHRGRVEDILFLGVAIPFNPHHLVSYLGIQLECVSRDSSLLSFLLYIPSRVTRF